MKKKVFLFLAMCWLIGSAPLSSAEPVLPKYVIAQEQISIQSETSQTSDHVVALAGDNDLLQVIGYSYDMEGNLWWRVLHTANGKDGYILAQGLNELTEEEAQLLQRELHANKNTLPDSQQDRKPSLSAYANPESPDYVLDEGASIEDCLHLNAQIARELELRTNASIEFSVPIGEWTVGKNLESGTYTLIPVKDGNFYKSSSIEIISPRWEGNYFSLLLEDGSIPFENLILLDGDTIRIDFDEMRFKKGPAVVCLSEALGTMYDLSSMPESELMALNEQIVKLLGHSDQISSFKLNGGMYVVGKDIPEGVYDVDICGSANGGNYTFELYPSLKDVGLFNGDPSVYGFADESNTIRNLELHAGEVVFLEDAAGIFTLGKKDVFFGPGESKPTETAASLPDIKLEEVQLTPEPTSTPTPISTATARPTPAPTPTITPSPTGTGSQEDDAEIWCMSSDGIFEAKVRSLDTKDYPNIELAFSFRLDGKQKSVYYYTVTHDLSAKLSSFVDQNPAYQNRKVPVSAQETFSSFRHLGGTQYILDIFYILGDKQTEKFSVHMDMALVFPEDFINYDANKAAMAIKASAQKLNLSEYSVKNCYATKSESYPSVSYYEFTLVGNYASSTYLAIFSGSEYAVIPYDNFVDTLTNPRILIPNSAVLYGSKYTEYVADYSKLETTSSFSSCYLSHINSYLK